MAMQLHSTKIDVLLDDGREVLAEADQRDFAAWEAAPENDGTGRGRTIMARYLAWSALRRAGEVKASFQRFNALECVQAMARPEEGEEETEQDNPTQD